MVQENVALALSTILFRSSRTKHTYDAFYMKEKSMIL